MSVFRVLLAGAFLAASTGCSQVRLVPKADAMHRGSLEGATVRTRTGEVYFFERADVAADSLSGFAQERRTVYLPGGEIQEVTEDRRVFLALEDVEQIQVTKRSWARAGLWALAIGGAVGLFAFVSNQSSGDDAGGGDYGIPPKPEP